MPFSDIQYPSLNLIHIIIALAYEREFEPIWARSAGNMHRFDVG